MPAPLASWKDTPARESFGSFAEGAADRLAPEERVGVFAGFTVISMKNDWSTVFGE
jgi:hypothetical protein